MGKVSTGLSMSLDGFIAGPNDGPHSPLGDGGERLFAWYSGGDIEYRLPGTEMVFKVSPQSADLLREAHSKMGAFVTGRRTFDIANGRGGRPPLGVPTFIVTHTVSQEWVYEGSPSRSSRTASKARLNRQSKQRAARTSPWAPRASCSSASGRNSSTKYT